MINLLVKEYNHVIHAAVRVYLSSTGWMHIGSGSFRAAYRKKNTVIKVPRNTEGFQDNLTEAYAYRKYRNNPDGDGIIFAPCRLLRNGCLMMPFVTRAEYDQMPTWAQFLDGAQAGLYKNRIVGYDTGYDIKHERQEAFQWAKVI